jgi:hypothetical protein
MMDKPRHLCLRALLLLEQLPHHLRERYVAILRDHPHGVVRDEDRVDGPPDPYSARHGPLDQ